MKEIKAILQEFMLPKVVEALRGHPEFPGLTVSRVSGFGSHGTEEELSETSPKIKLEIVVPAAHHGRGSVSCCRFRAATVRERLPSSFAITSFVCTVDEVVRIGTGQKGESAI